MKLHTLRPAKGSIKERKRVGRGDSSGHGGTSGRGHKGQKARSGGAKSRGFEGGQMPLQRRLPRLPGFKNRFKKDITPVNVERLNVFEAKATVDPEAMVEKGLIKKSDRLIKILAGGKLDKALTVKAHAFSKQAVEKIEAAGGKAEVF